MDPLQPRETADKVNRPQAVRLLLGALFACLFVHVAFTALGLGGDALDTFFNAYLYNAVMAGAALACLIRAALVRAERAAWLAIGAGLTAWSVGELYWTVHLSGLETIPYPSIADAFYIFFYPALYVGIVLLVRTRVTHFHASQWLDGAIGTFGAAAVGSALLYPAIRNSTGADAATVATNLAYPLGDLLLLSFVVGVVALTGWRPGRAWIFIGSGLLANALADGAYLYTEATSGYVEGTLIDSLWLFGSVLLAYAAWDSPRVKSLELHGLRLMLLPSAFALGALVLLVIDTFGSINRLAVGLASATLLVVLVRMVLSFWENLRLAAEAERANRAKSDFLANMSHELRTPLTAIIGFSEMMVEGSVEMDDRERTQFASRILSSGRHLRQLINDLLDLSKVEAGMMEFRSEKVDLPALVEEVEGTMRVLADNNQVQLITIVDAGLGDVVTDRSKLKQVIYNYVSNGIKFTPPGGHVTLFLEREQDRRFSVTVEDTGIGIREEDQQRLFREFHQVDMRAEKDQQGTGLGLALVKRIVEGQGGHVGVRSIPGKGSMFFAILPSLEPAAMAEVGAHPDEQPEHGADDRPEGADVAFARHSDVHPPDAREQR